MNIFYQFRETLDTCSLILGIFFSLSGRWQGTGVGQGLDSVVCSQVGLIRILEVTKKKFMVTDNI